MISEQVDIKSNTHFRDSAQVTSMPLTMIYMY